MVEEEKKSAFWPKVHFGYVILDMHIFKMQNHENEKLERTLHYPVTVLYQRELDLDKTNSDRGGCYLRSCELWLPVPLTSKADQTTSRYSSNCISSHFNVLNHKVAEKQVWQNGLPLR